jgi:hypothetical protein
LKSFLDQKTHSGLTTDGGLDKVYRTISVTSEKKRDDFYEFSD